MIYMLYLRCSVIVPDLSVLSSARIKVVIITRLKPDDRQPDLQPGLHHSGRERDSSIVCEHCVHPGLEVSNICVHPVLARLQQEAIILM